VGVREKMTIRSSNKRASGKGEIGFLFHAGRHCPALPEHERSPKL
jgi:hypothetical protein